MQVGNPATFAFAISLVVIRRSAKLYSTGDTLMATPETLPAVIRRELRRCNVMIVASWTAVSDFASLMRGPTRCDVSNPIRSAPNGGRVYARSAPRPPW